MSSLNRKECENLLAVSGVVKGREIWKHPKLQHMQSMA